MTFKYRGDSAEGWECELENTAQLDIETGSADEIDLRVKITWWAKPKQFVNQHRQIEILTFAIHGAPMLDKVGSVDLGRIEDYCRKVTDHQFEVNGGQEPLNKRRL